MYCIIYRSRDPARSARRLYHRRETLHEGTFVGLCKLLPVNAADLRLYRIRLNVH